MNGHCDMIRLLLRRGANLDARNEDNETADAEAHKQGHDKTCLLYTSDAADE